MGFLGTLFVAALPLLMALTPNFVHGEVIDATLVKVLMREGGLILFSVGLLFRSFLELADSGAPAPGTPIGRGLYLIPLATVMWGSLTFSVNAQDLVQHRGSADWLPHARFYTSQAAIVFAAVVYATACKARLLTSAASATAPAGTDVEGVDP